KEETSLTFLSGQFSEIARDVDAGQAAPTAEDLQALAEAGATLAKTMARWSSIKTRDLPTVNEKLKAAGLSPILTRSR
ncbi:MAG TPA: hypothetical protein VJR26_03030, partial [Candidatus Acidoferrales bacterium]|nr:hypothetical protein [Candidatus Acidoferrales bacterium]